MCMSCSVCSHCFVENTVGFLEPGECVLWRGEGGGSVWCGGRRVWCGGGGRGSRVLWSVCVLQLCAKWVSGVGSNKLASWLRCLGDLMPQHPALNITN